MMETLFNCSLWGDEAFSAVLAQKPLWPMLKIVAKDTSPPLFYLLSHFWFKIFGSTEIAIRTLSFLFYLGTVWVIGLLTQKLFGRKTAILASLLVFFNPFLFPYAFEGRMYFCLLFFTVLSFYFLATENEWGHILATTASLYSHHFAFLAIATQFLWQALIAKNLKIKSYLLIALFYLPWLYPLYLQTTLVAGGFWLGKPKLIHLWDAFTNFLQGSNFYSFQSKLPLLAIFLLLVRRWSVKNLKKDLLLILWAVAPLFFAFLISQSKLSIFYERYLLYSVPPLMILMASQTRKIFGPLVFLLLSAYIIVSYHHFTHPHKKPFRQFAQWIKNNVPAEMLIVNYNGQAHHLWESYYYGLQAPLYAPGGTLPFFVGTAQMTPKDILSQLPPDAKTIGVITSDPPSSLKIENYQLSGYQQFDSLAFVWFTRK